MMTVIARLRLTVQTNFFALLITVFPLGASLIHHWSSVLYIILLITGFFHLRYYAELQRDVRQLLFLFAVFYVLFFPGVFLYDGGWSGDQTKAFNEELRFIFLLPLLMVVLRYHFNWRMFIRYHNVAIVLSVLYVLYFFYHHNINMLNWGDGNDNDVMRAWGPYGGQLLSMFALFSLASAWVGWQHTESDKRWQWFSAICLVLSLVFILFSGVRGAILAAMLMVVYLLITQLRKKLWAMVVMGFGFMVMIALMSQLDYIRNKVINIPDIIAEYQSHGIDEIPSSIGHRIELAKATYYIAQEYPWFGVGRRNFDNEVVKLKAFDKISRNTLNTNHPHSIYFETLVGKGVVGLVVLLLIFGKLFILTRAKPEDSPLRGQAKLFLKLVLLAFVVLGLSDTYPFYRGLSINYFIIMGSVTILLITAPNPERLAHARE
jgi:O-antigen ligase